MGCGKLRRIALPLAIIVAVASLALLAWGCGSTSTTTTAAPGVSTGAPTTTTVGESDLILASTTSTKDSGLFDMLIPAFEKAYPQYNVKIVAVGSGEALKLGQSKDADVLLVHSPDQEATFIDQGYGVLRHAVMYNDFIIVGPASDPASIKGMTSAKEAFAKIASSKALFCTRGDNSGTNTKELSIWKAASITPLGSWYVKTGQGMGETLTVADQKGGYTFSDRATYLAKKNSLTLEVPVEGDPQLFNQYHVITVKGAENAQGATDFYSWVISGDVQQRLIGTFGVDRYGRQLFIPNAATAE